MSCKKEKEKKLVQSDISKINKCAVFGCIYVFSDLKTS